MWLTNQGRDKAMNGAARMSREEDKEARHSAGAETVIGWPLMQGQRLSLHEEIVGLLREMILEGKLEPGSRIAEAGLCRQLGVSRTPLREALKVLAAEQLVELLPNRGAVVSRITIEETAELFEVLEGYETLIGELAAQRITDEEIAELQRLHREMGEHHSHGRRSEYFMSNQKVHSLLAQTTRNSILNNDYVNYLRRVARARYSANYSQLRWDESMQEHEEFVAAAVHRDGPALSRLLRQHLRQTGESVLKAMRADNLAGRLKA
jgi:DNA-binding GntR family transcriptional regulator